MIKKILNRQVDKANFIDEAIGFVVLVGSFAVILGWNLDLELLLALDTDSVSMKFPTAFLFFLVGLTMVFDSRSLSVVIATISVVIAYTGAVYHEVPLMFPDFERTQGIDTVFPDMPSYMTLVCFCVFAFCHKHRLNEWGFRILCATGIIGLSGHLLDVEYMYYHTSFSTGMATGTAILFLLSGLWLKVRLN